MAESNIQEPRSGAFAFLKKLKMRGLLTLGKAERLKSRKVIGHVFEQGKKLNAGSIRVHYLFCPSQNCDSRLQVGVSVSSKNFRKATDRNRIKRLLREAWRTEKNELRERIGDNEQLFVFIIYNGREIPDFTRIKKDVGEIINSLLSNLKKTH